MVTENMQNELLKCLIDQVGGERQAYLTFTRSRISAIPKNMCIEDLITTSSEEGWYDYLKALTVSDFVATWSAGGGTVSASKPDRAGKRKRVTRSEKETFESRILEALGQQSELSISKLANACQTSQKAIVRQILKRLVDENRVVAIGERGTRKYRLS